MNDAHPEALVPREPYLKLFWRFLRFGLLAWGGPVAQIAMIRQELVAKERWISSERFNRILAVYQVLPGPEAHELCVYFGMLSRGRMGGFLAGLGFMFPGFALMFGLSWFYIAYGTDMPVFEALFRGMQPAVAALIVRAVYTIGGHALHNDRWLWSLALIAGFAHLQDIHFAVTLVIAGAVYVLARRNFTKLAMGLILMFVSGIIWAGMNSSGTVIVSSSVQTLNTPDSPDLVRLLISGLRSGLLTFGGAYTVIPFLQFDAVEVGRWMTNAQFLDGLALSGILPAPLIIFSTFVGYIGGGPLGALALTIGIFTPAFGFTLLAHDYIERMVENQLIHAFLDGVTAGVVGLIGATALTILRSTVSDPVSGIIFTLALLTLFKWRTNWTVAAVILGAGLAGILLYI